MQERLRNVILFWMAICLTTGSNCEDEIGIGDNYQSLSCESPLSQYRIQDCLLSLPQFSEACMGRGVQMGVMYLIAMTKTQLGGIMVGLREPVVETVFFKYWGNCGKLPLEDLLSS